MPDNKKGEEGGLGSVLFFIGLAIVLALLVFVFSPGMLVMSMIQVFFSTALDIAQMWTFSIILSIIIFFCIYLINNDRSVIIYPIICAAIVIIFTVSHFGFKAEFPVSFISYFFKDKAVKH